LRAVSTLEVEVSLRTINVPRKRK